ncbi:MAG: cytochrome c oxidase subunit [Actinomycetota bacterium]|nr:cytochrome c oxidase, subunit [Cryptosporangiaceae bacterium]MDQ1676976.1 cytochrome c oxidase subunit [Actinomycetota bacterium]
MVASRSLEHRRSGRAGRRLVPAGLLGLAVLVLSGCSPEENLRFGWPRGITTQSEQMLDLWIASTIAALVVGVAVWGLIFWCVVRYRKRGDELPAQTRYNLPIEIVYTIVPFLIIAVLFYYTAIVESAVTKESKNPDVTVEVVAFKWNWQFVYPEAKTADERPVTTVGTSDQIPVLVIPKDQNVRFTETSNDVIHSFWVPEILFKRDVFPGGIPNSFEIRPTKTGAFVGRCAELCGTYHANMNFEMRVVSQADYARYLDARQSGMSNPDALRAIGQEPFATTTHPFDTRRNTRQAS